MCPFGCRSFSQILCWRLKDHNLSGRTQACNTRHCSSKRSGLHTQSASHPHRPPGFAKTVRCGDVCQTKRRSNRCRRNSVSRGQFLSPPCCRCGSSFGLDSRASVYPSKIFELIAAASPSMKATSSESSPHPRPSEMGIQKRTQASS